MQFRMKKKKKAHKQQAAADKKVEKERKKQERLEKKKEKEQEKAEKAEQKRLAKEQKKAEKAASKKHKGEQDQEKEKESKGQKRPHEDSTMDENAPRETAPVSDHFKPKGLTSKRTKRKLLTLRHGVIAKKKATVKSHAPKNAKRRSAEAGSIASACAATSQEEKITEEPHQKTNQQEEPCSESIQPSAGSASKQNKPASQHKTQQKKQNKRGAKQKRKQANKKSPAVKTSNKKCKAEPCPKIVKLVQQVLMDCKATNCVHPTWEPMTFDAKTYQLSVYWSRKAVGLKMPKDLLHSRTKNKRRKAAKGKCKWSQVQYFACKTSCVYSNLLLAYEFVSRC